MIAEVKIPEVGESITEGILVEWLKKDGDFVNEGEEIYELETDKITLAAPAEVGGRLVVKVEAGTTVEIGQIVATIDTDAVATESSSDNTVEALEAPPLSPPAGMEQVREKSAPSPNLDDLSPAVKRLVAENSLNPADITGTGKDGRILKGDVLQFIESQADQKTVIAPPPPIQAAQPKPITKPIQDPSARQTREPMTSLRARIAERLVQSQQTAAILTTFNEVDMSAVMETRSKYKELFKDRHGVGLGFMSFFVKAVVDALKTYPKVNSQIDGADIVHNHYYDIGIAVSSERGLVVPVIRDADKLTFAEVEQQIAEYAAKARDRKLTLDELQGGVFTISNGGIFGSLLSTPILNPPQSAILGMHTIKRRPIVVDNSDTVEVRPMMYLAMSYDHRLIDGSESVIFLKRIVECIENPQRIMLGV